MELRAALIGFGLAGSVFHAPLIAATPGLELATVVTGNGSAPIGLGGVSRGRSRGEPGRGPRARRSLRPGRRRDAERHPRRACRGGDRGRARGGCRQALGADQLRGARPGRAGRTPRRRANRLSQPPLGLEQLTLRRLIGEGRLGDVFRYESRFERWRPEPRRDAWRETTSRPRAAECCSISAPTSSTRH